MSEQQKQPDNGNRTFSVKVTQEVYDLVNILCEGLEHGTNGNDLVKMFIHAFIESAKHDGPLSPDMQMLLNMLRLEPGWQKAFNFADVTALAEIAQIILVLQQKGRKGFGLVMIDKPFCDEAKATYCVDDILERVTGVSMRGLYKMLRQIGIEIGSDSLRETLTILCDAQTIAHLEEMERQELPGYGENHDWGRAIEYGRKTKGFKHRTPDSVAQQQTIHFESDDVPDLPELQDNEGEFKGNSDDGLIDGIRPFDVEP